MMAKVKVGITLDEDLLRRIDEYSDENYMNRSSLLSLAASQYLNSQDIIRAVKEMAFAMRKIADAGEVDAETMRQLEDFERLAKLLVQH